ncbi:MAG: dephospho-CoA kinase, partial [Bacteroidales bacterium]|nr:dephospho-CoA kinase [Bacteroidales bacterium]
MKRIAIVGGIGSGKSVVSRLLSLMGYPVYDCDSNAKRLMDESE